MKMESNPAKPSADTPDEPTAGAAEEKTPPPGNLEQELKDKIRALEEEIAALRDQRLRAVAETDNVRKRAQRDQEDIARYAAAAFARDMVQVLENLKRASESLPADVRGGDERLKALGEGVDLTLQDLLNVFARHGIVRIDPLQQPFDPNQHQAVTQVERGDLAPGTVAQVIQAGYKMHDRLLRPAMVAVSKQGESPKAVDTTA